MLVSSKLCVIILTRTNYRKYIAMEIQGQRYLFRGGSQEVSMFQRILMVLKNIFPKTKF